MEKNLRSFYIVLLALAFGSGLSAERPPNPDRKAEYDRTADPHDFTVFMEEGGWCWFQDPRAIIHGGNLFIGSIKGSGTGDALIGVYDLEARKPLGIFVARKHFQRDDHNSPVFIRRPDGSLLATYAKHHKDKFHYSRILDSDNPLAWGEEFKHKRNSPNKKDRVTYMNLYEMTNEGLLYNFYRGIDYNPTFVTSADYGETWSEPVHFFASEGSKRNRPYLRYAGNGEDIIHLSATNAHPRSFRNNLYHAVFKDGKFYKADGTFIKDLEQDGPLLPSEAEVVYASTGPDRKPEGADSFPGAAWTSAIELDADGHPHMAYSVHNSNEDIRYRLASWDGDQWTDREIAYGGNCLYARESSYSGLVTMDPVDPTLVFISSDVDPSTGEDTGGKHEIYRAKIGPEDNISTIEWQAVTENSPVRNIRPMILREDNRRIALWQRGDFVDFTNYQLDTVGFVENT